MVFSHFNTAQTLNTTFILTITSLLPLVDSTTNLNEPVINWEELLESRTWLTAHNQRIPISEMSTNHILNTINCLTGISSNKIPHNWNGKTHDRWLYLFRQELQSR